MLKAWVITISDIESTSVMYVALDSQSAMEAFEKAKRGIISDLRRSIRHYKNDIKEFDKILADGKDTPRRRYFKYVASQLEYLQQHAVRNREEDIAIIKNGKFPGEYGKCSASLSRVHATEYPIIDSYHYALNGKKILPK